MHLSNIDGTANAMLKGKVPRSISTATVGKLEEIQPKIKKRPRKVWVKARPLGNVPSGGSDRSKVLQLILINTISVHFRWMHWALEVGSWTYEVALDGKASSRMIVRRVHRAQHGHEWDNEIQRVCVGETSMTDEEVEECREYPTSCSTWNQFLKPFNSNRPTTVTPLH